MKRLVVSVSIILFAVASANAAIAAWQCGEPAPAPQLKPGDKWTWQDEKGGLVRQEVVGLEGNLAVVRLPSGEKLYFDSGRVLRKVVSPTGNSITKPGVRGLLPMIGLQSFPFPLTVGKSWGYGYTAQAPSGDILSYSFERKVVSCEELKTKAGEFSALKIEGREYVIGVNAIGGRYYIWWAPDVKTIAKKQFVPSQWWGQSALGFELVEFEPSAW